MGEFPRKSDGRLVFTVEFKRGVVQQLLKGEKTLAEVSRELDIQPSVVRQWKRRFEAGATAAVATNEDVVPVSALREAHQRIRELERLVGNKQMEIEILQATQEVVKKVRGCAKGPDGDPASGGHDLPNAADGRQTAYYAARVRPAGFYRRLDDETVLQQIRAVTNSRATYGYRRVRVMVNRTFRAGYTRKRIRRLMRMHGLMLPPRVHRRHGRPHLGQVQQPASNQRWCSDIFLIPCWSGEVLSVASRSIATIGRSSHGPRRSTCCYVGCSSPHEVQEESDLRVHEVADVNRQPAAGLSRKVCLAEAIPSTVHGMRDVVRQIQRFVRILGDRCAKPVPDGSGQGEDLVRRALAGVFLPVEGTVEALEASVG